MLSIERHPVYDNPVKWGTPGIWEPPVFDAAGYQKKIDAIVGTSLGKPIVRLIWAWDNRGREFNFTKWDSSGKGVEGEWERKYRVARVPIGNGNTTDICPPRWLFEQRYEPGQYGLSWERTRWASKDVGKNHKCSLTEAEMLTEECDCEPIRARVELKPPPPSDGWYQLLWAIAEHEPGRACCARVYEENRRNCWGLYRLPAEKDLERLRRAVSLRNADAQKVGPHAPSEPDVLAEIHRAAFAEHEEDERRKRRENDDIFRVSPGISPTKRLKNGRWHDVKNDPFRVTSAGLLVPRG